MSDNNKEPRKLTLGAIITYVIALLFFLFVFYMLTLNWHG